MKPINEIYARYKLSTCKQTDGESIDTYIQDLHRLRKYCNFQAVTAEQHRQGYVCDDFISGIQSKDIRQKLLENVSLTMEQIFDQARTLQMAHKNAESYSTNSFSLCATNCQHSIISEESNANQDSHNPTAAAMYSHPDQSCFFCGHPWHPRNLCPAKNSKCKLCGRTGHWERACKSSNKTSNSSNNQYRQQNPQQQRYQHGTSAAIWPSLAAIPQGGGETTAYCKIKIKKSKINALINTGSTSCSFIHKHLVTRLKLPIIPAVGEVSMANVSFTTKVEGECIVDIQLRKRKYKKVKLYILDNLCAEVILGRDFMEQHKNIVFNFGGSKPSLIVSALTAMNVTPPRLFEHLTDDCRPVALRSRKQTPSNAKFIREEVKRLLNDGIIKPSTSGVHRCWWQRKMRHKGRG